ncbi:hypothetical protein E3P99_02468 [Wallemia hederae]|uniref:Uncharacterized protein n=1 Tax=Wallemia hederae TaxID=1540922 RepID=A0A4T0FKS6_9BASI|nr:hypothetical protein E3P99_02468 [Wallemia hederae]
MSDKINSKHILDSFIVHSLLLKLTSTQALDGLVNPRHADDPALNSLQQTLNDDLKRKLWLVKHNIEYEFKHTDYDYSTSDETQYQYSITLDSANSLLNKKLNHQFHQLSSLDEQKQALRAKIQERVQQLSHTDQPKLTNLNQHSLLSRLQDTARR